MSTLNRRRRIITRSTAMKTMATRYQRRTQQNPPSQAPARPTYMWSVRVRDAPESQHGAWLRRNPQASRPVRYTTPPRETEEPEPKHHPRNVH
ncbi:hypothetical protein VTK56DRAFT_10052 [Thermocarpiscus australiensis]